VGEVVHNKTCLTTLKAVKEERDVSDFFDCYVRGIWMHLIKPNISTNITVLFFRTIHTLDVQITSRKLIFIQLSHVTKCPLYVSPFFNSTSYKQIIILKKH